MVYTFTISNYSKCEGAISRMQGCGLEQQIKMPNQIILNTSLKVS